MTDPLVDLKIVERWPVGFFFVCAFCDGGVGKYHESSIVIELILVYVIHYVNSIVEFGVSNSVEHTELEIEIYDLLGYESHRNHSKDDFS